MSLLSFMGPPGTTSSYITTHIIGTTLPCLMSVPTSEVGYTSAMPRREDHEVHKDMWGHWGGGGITSLLYDSELLNHASSYFITTYQLPSSSASRNQNYNGHVKPKCRLTSFRSTLFPAQVYSTLFANVSLT